MARKPDPAVRRRWIRLIDSFRAGSETIADFCSRSGVSTASFYQWRRRLEAERSADAGVGFVPVEVHSDIAAGRSDMVRFCLSSTTHVEVPADRTELVVRAIVALAAENDCEEGEV